MSTGDSEDFASMLDAFEKEQAPARRAPRPGEMVEGRVISIGAEAVFVDLGGKSEGVLDLDQVSDDEGNLKVVVGDTVSARVVEVGGKAGAIVLRTQLGRGPDATAELAQAYELGMPVDGTVTATNKGGVEVTIAGLRAFCPVSQLDNRFVENPETFVGQRLQFKITKLEGGKRPNIVVSRRALLEIEAIKRAEDLRQSLAAGDQIRGTVTQIKPFGAFVDLGGIEGMIHISELGHTRVEDPSEVVSVGQQVDVAILKIEEADESGKAPRIGLSLKALQGDPWSSIAERFKPGTVIDGTVVRLQPYGAFIEIAPGVEGLAHVSELDPTRRIAHPRDVTEVGAKVAVTVLSVDPSQRRVSLSMAAAGRASAHAEEQANIRENSPRSPNSLGTFGDLLKNVKLK